MVITDPIERLDHMAKLPEFRIIFSGKFHFSFPLSDLLCTVENLTDSADVEELIGCCDPKTISALRAGAKMLTILARDSVRHGIHTEDEYDEALRMARGEIDEWSVFDNADEQS